jgi:type II secretory ATPase GspE/PulE/Tfp pilus assembly ATPase PilB-like protein
MNIKNILTPKQIDICKQEKNYFQRIGIKKNILQIAIEHNFIQKKEKNNHHSLELIKKYEIIIVNEDKAHFYIECKELIGPKRLAELEEQLSKSVVQKTIPVREFQEKFEAILSIDPEVIEKKIKQFNAFDSDDTEILELFSMILKHGIRNSVSDIHINAYEEF